MIENPPLNYQVKTSQEMRDLGELIAHRVVALGRDFILLLLDGELGAGKTTFSQGFFRALGVQEEVTSPSYGILHVYEGKSSCVLYHMDMYRITSLDEAEELGIEEILSSQEPFIFVVEWASKFPELWGNLRDVHVLSLLLKIEEEGRSLSVEGL